MNPFNGKAVSFFILTCCNRTGLKSGLLNSVC